jgi:hypothetical protein
LSFSLGIILRLFAAVPYGDHHYHVYYKLQGIFAYR